MTKLVKLYHQIENIIIALLLSLLLILTFSQVVSRLLFKTSLPDADPVIYHLILWIGLLGAVLATREKEHITIDIISRFVKGRLGYIINVITDLFTCVVCGLLTWVSIRFIIDEIRYTDMLIAGIPGWVYQLIIPASFGIMSIRYVIATLGSIKQVFTFRASDKKGSVK